MNDESLISVLSEIRNWIRAASYPTIKDVLLKALPDQQTRKAYQMMDGTASSEQVRISCKMSPNKVVSLTQKWTSMGLMEVSAEKKRRRLFDLQDFDLLDTTEE